MNRKQLLALIVLGVVLGALGIWAYKKKQEPYESSTKRMGEKVVPNFPINDVTAISIKTRDANCNLVKKNEVWVVQERAGYPANFGNVSDLLRKVWDLKVAKPVRVSQTRLGQLELLPPEKSPSTLVEFKKADGKPATSLLLGKKHERESRGDQQFGGGSWPDGRYVMVGNDIQSVALISEPFSNVEPKPEEWLNKDWFKVEKLKSISVVSTNATNNWTLSRESETNEWKLADTKAGEQIDSGKISGVTGALSYPNFNDVATNSAPEATGMNKPTVTAKLETFDGFTYDVKVGNKSGTDDNYFFQVAVNGSVKKERTAGKDEKPEDKAKLDKEFKEKADKQEEKLKTEKNFSNWTYIVSKYTIDPLLKERKDLMQEKKEETKPTEKKEEVPPPTGTSSSSKTEPPPPPGLPNFLPEPLVKPPPPKPSATITNTGASAKPAEKPASK
jgi:hypothetical protein